MTKRLVFESMVFILMIGSFALPARLVAGKEPFSGPLEVECGQIGHAAARTAGSSH